MQRRIDAERARLRAEVESREKWANSPFRLTSAVVRQPRGDFAVFLRQIDGHVSRKLWRPAFVGQSPDGLTRLTRERTFFDGRVERRAWGLKRVDAYSLATTYGSLLVLLRDGRAGYTGDLQAWRRIIPEMLAEEQVYGGNYCADEYDHYLGEQKYPGWPWRHD